MKNFIEKSTLIILLTFVLSCASSDKTSSEATENTTDTMVNDDTAKSTVLYNIPSPTETFITLKMSDVKFDKSILNPPSNISKYITSTSKALNLGTYSADLSFCILYNQNQDVNIYLKNTHELATGLNINGDFVEDITKRVKANSNNLDSMMQIVSEANVNINMYLNENGMNSTVALISAGGWLEGLYIITAIADKTKNKDIIGLVADQKPGLKNLVNMLEQFKSDAEIAKLLTDIKEIATVYDSLKPVEVVAKKSANKDVVSVGGNTSYELTNEELKLIFNKALALRTKLTN